MAEKIIQITDCDGVQKFKSDYTILETVAILEFWKTRIILNKLQPDKKLRKDKKCSPNTTESSRAQYSLL
jgi:hypothetical protein